VTVSLYADATPLNESNAPHAASTEIIFFEVIGCLLTTALATTVPDEPCAESWFAERDWPGKNARDSRACRTSDRNAS
jgi:hypothetical protein